MAKTNHDNSAQRISDAALELFSLKGYEATSVREICDLARITKPTLYYFYKNKEGVYRALIESAGREFQEHTQTALATEGNLCTRYKALVRRFFHEASSNPRLVRFMFSIVWMAPNTPFADELNKFLEEALALMSKHAKQAVQRGEISPGDNNVRMLVLMGAVGEVLSRFLIFGRPKPTPKLADQLVDTIFDGWHPRRSNARA